MKKHIILFLIFSFVSYIGYSQERPQPLPGATQNQVADDTPKMNTSKGFYLRANAGFAFAHAGSTLGEEVTFISEGNYRYQNIDGSLGRGIKLEGAIGYMFNDHIGADLSLLYQFGVNYEISKVSTVNPIPQNSPHITDLRGSMFAITPSAILTTGANKKIVPYIKLGLLIALPHIAKLEENSDIRLDKKTNYYGGVSLGFTGGLGIEYKVNNNVNVYGEVKLNSLSYTPTQSEIVNWDENGRDLLPDMKTTDKKKELVEFITDKTRTDNEELSVSYPFSSLGLNIGVKFKFF